MDYIKGISLKQYIKAQNHRAIKTNIARRFFKQIAECMCYLHSLNVVHRDIKLDNILIEEDTKMVKMIDFGFSVIVNQNRLKIFCGTPNYMSPEIVRRVDYDGKPVDMWALGVLLYVMLTGTFPFKGTSEQDLFKKIRNGYYNVNHEAICGNKEIKELLSRLLDTDHIRRMTAEELVEHPFVKCDDLRLTIFESAPTLKR